MFEKLKRTRKIVVYLDANANQLEVMNKLAKMKDIAHMRTRYNE